jgi:hypothetical protein
MRGRSESMQPPASTNSRVQRGSDGLLRTAQYCGAILSSALTAIVLSDHAGARPMQFLGLALLPLACLFALLAIRKDRPGEAARS